MLELVGGAMHIPHMKVLTLVVQQHGEEGVFARLGNHKQRMVQILGCELSDVVPRAAGLLGSGGSWLRCPLVRLKGN